MKRSMTRVCLLLLTSLLLSCGGGGGDSSSGGSTGAPSSSNPANDTGGNPGNDGGGNPPSGGGAGTPPSVGLHFEESDAAVTRSGDWKLADASRASPGDCRGFKCSFGWSGGGAVQSTETGAMVSFAFKGTSVTWIGSRGKRAGKAELRVDGGPAITVDLYASLNDEIRTPVFTIHGLSDSSHVLTIKVTGDKNPAALDNVVVVDAFDVQGPIVSHIQEADPDITFNGPWEEAGGALMWSGGDARNKPEVPITAKVTATAAATATLKFRGTGIRWIGYRGPDAGMAVVTVDGGAPTLPIDLYSDTIMVQEVVFTATGLPEDGPNDDKTHTLTITVHDQKNPASTAAKVYVDAFDVMTQGTRYQEEDLAASYHRDDPTTITYEPPDWVRNTARVWSEGRVRTFTASAEGQASVTFSFTGTGVSWIGCEKSSIGRAKVFLDGDEVSPKDGINMRIDPPLDPEHVPPTEGYQRTIYRVDGLPKGPHVLEIRPVSGITVVDAFDVRP